MSKNTWNRAGFLSPEGGGMVYKRKDVYWYDFCVDGKRFRQSAKTSNRSLALRIEADKRSNALLVPVKKVFKFDQFLNEVFLPWSKTQNKRQTHRRYTCSAKPLKGFFGSFKLGRITNAEIEGFKMWRLKQCSPAGVNRDLAALRFILNWAVRNSYLMRSPYNTKLLAEGPGNTRIVSVEEEQLYI